MINKNQIYRCSVCGNIVEVLFVGGGQLVCCGKPMNLLEARTQDVGAEKHVPVIFPDEKGVRVQIGEIAHPMEEKHFIQWISVLTKNGQILRQDLKATDKPEAFFNLKIEEILTVWEYCNLHSLWKKDL